MERKGKEDEQKKKVRLRDKRCRFPLCGCKKFNLALHVSHKEHKGSGGNPKGERSDSSLLILVCCWRHKEGRIAIDRRTLRWIPLTEKGANGPVRWEVDGESLQPFGRIPDVADAFVPHGWTVVATESAIGVLHPLEDWQRVILQQLATMRS